MTNKFDHIHTNTNKKYIILNCPMYFHNNCYGHTGNCECQDCTNCVLKQIIELCKKVKLTYGELDKPLTAIQCTALFSRATLADEILQLLDV